MPNAIHGKQDSETTKAGKKKQGSRLERARLKKLEADLRGKSQDPRSRPLPVTPSNAGDKQPSELKWGHVFTEKGYDHFI